MIFQREKYDKEVEKFMNVLVNSANRLRTKQLKKVALDNLPTMELFNLYSNQLGEKKKPTKTVSYQSSFHARRVIVTTTHNKQRFLLVQIFGNGFYNAIGVKDTSDVIRKDFQAGNDLKFKTTAKITLERNAIISLDLKIKIEMMLSFDTQKRRNY